MTTTTQHLVLIDPYGGAMIEQQGGPVSACYCHDCAPGRAPGYYLVTYTEDEDDVGEWTLLVAHAPPPERWWTLTNKEEG